MNTKSSMQKEYKEKWIKALRSGKYTQGKGALYNKNDYSFCCLGVLQHCLTGGVEYNQYNDNPRGSPTIEWLKDWDIKFVDAYNRENYMPYFKLKYDLRSAAYCNDILEYDFNKIADIIEEQIEGI